MKWTIFLVFLMQRNCISSQPLTNEDMRESKLNFDECCPCHHADRAKDNIVLGSNHIPAKCPCRDADTETASSIFSPTFRAAQPFARPYESKDEAKPLLNPEVGLASSVLETLREVSDQEYEEALARDAARSALQMVSSVEDMPLSKNINVFNNLLRPRNKEAIDVIPEASHNEETHCILPTLGQVNEFGQFDSQPQRNSLKELFSSKAATQNNMLDMDKSPSDIQENTLPPKNKLLDDIKTKTYILKSKLFPNNKGSLQRMVTDKPFDTILQNKPKKKIPAWKYVAPLDNLKSSKFFDSDDVLKNNMRRNKKVVITQPLETQKSNKDVTDVLSSEVQRLKNTKDNINDSDAETSISNPVISQRDDCNIKKEYMRIETSTEKIDATNVIDANTSNLPFFIPPHNNTEILDSIPNASEILEDEDQLIDATDSKPHEDSIIENQSEINIKPNPDQTTTTYENSNPTSNVKPTNSQNTNNLSIEKQLEDSDKYIPGTVCTTESSKSEISSFYSESTPIPISINTNVFNLPIYQNEEGNSNNQKEEIALPTNNIFDLNKGNPIKIFPNLKEDIIKTFENVKNLNEKLKEKIKLNVQDALHLADVKNNIVMQEEPKENPIFKPEILATPHKTNAKTSNITSNALSSQELQKMSDSILTLSSIKQNFDPNSRILMKEVSDTLDTFDSNVEPSKTINCLTPAEVYNNNMFEKKAVNSNSKEIITSSSNDQQLFRRLKTGMKYGVIGDYPKKSDISLEKSFLNRKEPSSDRFEESEMAAQASEPKPQRRANIGLDNSRYIKQDFNAQPNIELDEYGRSQSNVKNFFDNVKSKIPNVFSTDNDNENNFRQTEDNGDTIYNNYEISKQSRAFDLEKPKFNFEKTPDTYQTHTVERSKSNLNPYKARVAVPDSFNLKPILTPDETVDKKIRTLNSHRNILPQTYSTNPLAYNSNENNENENLRSIFRESVLNNPKSEPTLLSPNIFQNNFRSSESKPLGNLKDRTEIALQNIHNSLGNSLRAVPFKENSRFLNNIGHENLFETMASKRNELNEKLQAINSDLNDRLSSLSQRMTGSILPSFNSQHLPQRRKPAKSRSDIGNKQGVEYLRRVNVPSDVRRTLQSKQSNDKLSALKPLKKSLNNPLSDIKTPRLYENTMSPRLTVKPAFKSSYINKSPKTEVHTIKPKYKENKILSVTANSRPKTLKSALQVPQTIKKDSTLIPKVSAKKSLMSLNQLKSSEPYGLGSENIMSKVLLDKKKESAIDVSSEESNEKFVSKASKQEVARNLALSKLKEALTEKMLNRSDKKDNYPKSSSNTDLDVTPSASENVNRGIKGTLKQNVQYKCKMLCTEDK